MVMIEYKYKIDATTMYMHKTRARVCNTTTIAHLHTLPTVARR